MSLNYQSELATMVENKNLMNSYKLYFLKSIIMNVSVDKYIFDFYELACWMCAYALKDVCALGHRIRPLDKLYDAISMILDKEDLFETTCPIDVFNILQGTEKQNVRRSVFDLVSYVPYRLLAYLWQEELYGRQDISKNKIIEMYSKENGRNMYIIHTEGRNKQIILQSGWKKYLLDNRNRLIPWIDSRIREFVWKEGM